jgi:hypothetical protein
LQKRPFKVAEYYTFFHLSPALNEQKVTFDIQSAVSIASPEARKLFGRQWHVLHRYGSQYRFPETG